MLIYGIVRKRILTDGPGITDLIGMAECPLNCAYCLNKETISNAKTYDITPQQLLDLVLPEACYFYSTQGGVTFGGGEPLLQADGIIEFAKIIPEWMKINVETSLNINKKNVLMLIPYINEWIIDIKSLDEEIYKQYTKQFPKYENLGLLPKEKCHIRIPIIPNYKSEEIAMQEKEKLINMGFHNIEVFTYITERNDAFKID